MITLGKYYGLTPMTLAEEMNAPQYVRQTRFNKVKMVDEMQWVQKIAAQLEKQAKDIPEEDDEHHATLVQELRDCEHAVYVAMELALKKSWGG